MNYTIEDLSQAAIGSFLGILFIFSVRGGNPLGFNPVTGMFITAILILVYYRGFRMQNKSIHFIFNGVIAFGVSVFMASTFGIFNFEQALTREVFGSFVIVGFWVGFPAALIYDRFNILDPMKRMFVRGKR